MNFDYKNHTIQVTSSGVFTAVVNGTTIEKPSLDAMKKVINEAIKDDFGPFEGYVLPPSYSISGDLVKVMVVGAIKSNYHYNKFDFVLKGNTDKPSHVLEISPVNEAIYEELRAFNQETTRIKKERDKAADDIRARFNWIKADQVMLAKNAPKPE